MTFRFQIFLSMFIVPCLCLGLFLFFLVDAFRKDKREFIVETQEMLSDTLPLAISKVLLAPAVQGQSEALPKQDHDLLCHPSRQALWLAGKGLWVCRNGNDSLPSTWKVDAPELTRILRKNVLVEAHLIGLDGYVVSSSLEDRQGTMIKTRVPSLDTKTLFNEGKSQLEFLDSTGKKQIAAFKRLNNWPLGLLTLTPEAISYRAAYPLLVKGMLSLLSILGIVLVLAMILSGRLVRQLAKISEVMANFGKGKLDARIANVAHSRNELAQIGNNFNLMADKVVDLLDVQAKVAATTHEIELAARLQTRFLPQVQTSVGSLLIEGRVVPAAQCGGDWWFIFETPTSVVVGIGDVTGHGLNSSLLTSAGRAAVSIVQNNFVSCGQLMEVLNQTTVEVTRGELQMTMFAAEIEKSGKWIRYCNASHEAGVLVKPDTQRLSAENFLFETHGPRLGENPSVKYHESEVALDGRWTLWLSSDGVLFDLPSGKKVNERLLGQFL